MTDDEKQELTQLLDKTFDQKLQPIEKRLDGMDTRFDGIEKRLDGMDTRLANLEVGQNHLSSKIAEVKQDVIDTRQVLEAFIESVDEQGESIDKRVTAIEEELQLKPRLTS